MAKLRLEAVLDGTPIEHEVATPNLIRPYFEGEPDAAVPMPPLPPLPGVLLPVSPG
jgi:hypothetical protein